LREEELGSRVVRRRRWAKSTLNCNHVVATVNCRPTAAKRSDEVDSERRYLEGVVSVELAPG